MNKVDGACAWHAGPSKMSSQHGTTGTTTWAKMPAAVSARLEHDAQWTCDHTGVSMHIDYARRRVNGIVTLRMVPLAPDAGKLGRILLAAEQGTLGEKPVISWNGTPVSHVKWYFAKETVGEPEYLHVVAPAGASPAQRRMDGQPCKRSTLWAHVLRQRGSRGSFGLEVQKEDVEKSLVEIKVEFGVMDADKRGLFQLPFDHVLHASRRKRLGRVPFFRALGRKRCLSSLFPICAGQDMKCTWDFDIRVSGVGYSAQAKEWIVRDFEQGGGDDVVAAEADGRVTSWHEQGGGFSSVAGGGCVGKGKRASDDGEHGSLVALCSGRHVPLQRRRAVICGRCGSLRGERPSATSTKAPSEAPDVSCVCGGFLIPETAFFFKYAVDTVAVSPQSIAVVVGIFHVIPCAMDESGTVSSAESFAFIPYGMLRRRRLRAADVIESLEQAGVPMFEELKLFFSGARLECDEDGKKGMPKVAVLPHFGPLRLIFAPNGHCIDRFDSFFGGGVLSTDLLHRPDELDHQFVLREAIATVLAEQFSHHFLDIPRSDIWMTYAFTEVLLFRLLGETQGYDSVQLRTMAALRRVMASDARHAMLGFPLAVAPGVRADCPEMNYVTHASSDIEHVFAASHVKEKEAAGRAWGLASRDGAYGCEADEACLRAKALVICQLLVARAGRLTVEGLLRDIVSSLYCSIPGGRLRLAFLHKALENAKLDARDDDDESDPASDDEGHATGMRLSGIVGVDVSPLLSRCHEVYSHLPGGESQMEALHKEIGMHVMRHPLFLNWRYGAETRCVYTKGAWLTHGYRAERTERGVRHPLAGPFLVTASWVCALTVYRPTADELSVGRQVGAIGGMFEYLGRGPVGALSPCDAAELMGNFVYQRGWPDIHIYKSGRRYVADQVTTAKSTSSVFYLHSFAAGVARVWTPLDFIVYVRKASKLPVTGSIFLHWMCADSSARVDNSTDIKSESKQMGLDKKKWFPLLNGEVAHCLAFPFIGLDKNVINHGRLLNEPYCWIHVDKCDWFLGSCRVALDASANACMAMFGGSSVTHFVDGVRGVLSSRVFSSEHADRCLFPFVTREDKLPPGELHGLLPSKGAPPYVMRQLHQISLGSPVLLFRLNEASFAAGFKDMKMDAAYVPISFLAMRHTHLSLFQVSLSRLMMQTIGCGEGVPRRVTVPMRLAAARVLATFGLTGESGVVGNQGTFESLLEICTNWSAFDFDSMTGGFLPFGSDVTRIGREVPTASAFPITSLHSGSTFPTNNVVGRSMDRIIANGCGVDAGVGVTRLSVTNGGGGNGHQHGAGGRAGVAARIEVPVPHFSASVNGGRTECHEAQHIDAIQSSFAVAGLISCISACETTYGRSLPYAVALIMKLVLVGLVDAQGRHGKGRVHVSGRRVGGAVSDASYAGYVRCLANLRVDAPVACPQELGSLIVHRDVQVDMPNFVGVCVESESESTDGDGASLGVDGKAIEVERVATASAKIERWCACGAIVPHPPCTACLSRWSDVCETDAIMPSGDSSALVDVVIPAIRRGLVQTTAIGGAGVGRSGLSTDGINGLDGSVMASHVVSHVGLHEFPYNSTPQNDTDIELRRQLDVAGGRRFLRSIAKEVKASGWAIQGRGVSGYTLWVELLACAVFALSQDCGRSVLSGSSLAVDCVSRNGIVTCACLRSIVYLCTMIDSIRMETMRIGRLMACGRSTKKAATGDCPLLGCGTEPFVAAPAVFGTSFWLQFLSSGAPADVRVTAFELLVHCVPMFVGIDPDCLESDVECDARRGPRVRRLLWVHGERVLERMVALWFRLENVSIASYYEMEAAADDQTSEDQEQVRTFVCANAASISDQERERVVGLLVSPSCRPTRPMLQCVNGPTNPQLERSFAVHGLSDDPTNNVAYVARSHESFYGTDNFLDTLVAVCPDAEALPVVRDIFAQWCVVSCEEAVLAYGVCRETDDSKIVFSEVDRTVSFLDRLYEGQGGGGGDMGRFTLKVPDLSVHSTGAIAAAVRWLPRILRRLYSHVAPTDTVDVQCASDLHGGASARGAGDNRLDRLVAPGPSVWNAALSAGECWRTGNFKKAITLEGDKHASVVGSSPHRRLEYNFPRAMQSALFASGLVGGVLYAALHKMTEWVTATVGDTCRLSRSRLSLLHAVRKTMGLAFGACASENPVWDSRNNILCFVNGCRAGGTEPVRPVRMRMCMWLSGDDCSEMEAKPSDAEKEQPMMEPEESVDVTLLGDEVDDEIVSTPLMVDGQVMDDDDGDFADDGDEKEEDGDGDNENGMDVLEPEKQDRPSVTQDGDGMDDVDLFGADRICGWAGCQWRRADGEDVSQKEDSSMRVATWKSRVAGLTGVHVRAVPVVHTVACPTTGLVYSASGALMGRSLLDAGRSVETSVIDFRSLLEERKGDAFDKLQQQQDSKFFDDAEPIVQMESMFSRADRNELRRSPRVMHASTAYLRTVENECQWQYFDEKWQDIACAATTRL